MTFGDICLISGMFILGILLILGIIKFVIFLFGTSFILGLVAVGILLVFLGLMFDDNISYF